MLESTKNKIREMVNKKGLRIIAFTKIEEVEVVIVKPDDGVKNRVYKEIPKDPTISQMVSNFAGAMVDWAKSGFKIVSQEVFDERLGVCRGCEAWDEEARSGMGKCRDIKCGCTKLKHWLKSSKCPRGLW